MEKLLIALTEIPIIATATAAIVVIVAAGIVIQEVVEIPAPVEAAKGQKVELAFSVLRQTSSRMCFSLTALVWQAASCQRAITRRNIRSMHYCRSGSRCE
jgi:hypothetical protein